MAIRITARPARGIGRVGVFHPPEPTVFPDEYFSEGEVETLRNDADLIVELLDDELVTPGEKRHLELLTGAAATDGAEGGVPTEVPGDRAPVVYDHPPVAELEKYLAGIMDVQEIRDRASTDTRKTAQPIYEARLAELEAAASEPTADE